MSHLSLYKYFSLTCNCNPVLAMPIRNNLRKIRWCPFQSTLWCMDKVMHRLFALNECNDFICMYFPFNLFAIQNFLYCQLKKHFYMAKIKWNNLCQIEENHKIGPLCDGHFSLSKTEGLCVICTLEVWQGPLQEFPKQVW